jgi:hypothetical protein
MFEGRDVVQILALLSPLIAIQLGLAVYCLTRILKTGTANLNKLLWSLIVVFINVIGPLAFLLLGKRRDR